MQRGVALSTASLASYHLGRLVEAGYVSQNESGKYAAKPQASGEILDGYSKIGVAVVPQLFFFAVLFTILTIFFSYESLAKGDLIVYLVATAVATVGVLWYQTVRLWRRLEA